MTTFDPRSQAWIGLGPDEIVRRVRCEAHDAPDEGDSPAQIWREACDMILLRMGKHPSQSPTPDGVIKDRGEDGADLNARLKAAGMYSIPEMMGVTPLTRWTVQSGMTDLDAFAAWLDRRVGQFLRMKAGYELGDKDKGDELYEWVNAHSAALSEVRENFRAAREAMAEAPASTVQPPSSQESGVGEPMTLVPTAALKWLNGEGVDHMGKWFGEASDQNGAFWWRSRFRAMCAALSAPRPSQREG